MADQEARSAAQIHTDSTDLHTCGDRGSAARGRGERRQSPTQADVEAERKLREALVAIVIRCEEGDPDTDWLPIIRRIAKEALA